MFDNKDVEEATGCIHHAIGYAVEQCESDDN